MKAFDKIYKNSALIMLVWTAIVAGSLIEHNYTEHQQSQELATKEARSHFNKDKAFRLWGASHGGVYVPTDERTPPNPMLSHIPERDITTPSGKKLTLMNPAYMIRQMMNEYSDLFGVKGSITTFPEKLFNINNAPDDWELTALMSFMQGKEEVLEFTEIGGQPYLRLMRPLFINETCMKCHAFQGYKVGDLRGGVGVSVPMDSYLTTEKKEIRSGLISHGVIWLLVICSILIITWRSKKQLSARLLAQKKLMDAKENAEYANRTKTEFLANMSHELRTPLNSIIGFSQMLEDETFGHLGSDKNMQYVKDINYSGQHLLEVINEILDISRVEAGEIVVEKVEVDLHEIVSSCLRMSKDRATVKGLKLTSDITSHRPTFRADVRHVKQIILNLISNAIKFTPEGGVVTIGAAADDNRSVIMTVKDTGIGIAPENIQKVLEPFSQVENIMTRSHEGTGLGLPMSKRLTELNGGTFSISSELGEGTTVTVRFPSERTSIP